MEDSTDWSGLAALGGGGGETGGKKALWGSSARRPAELPEEGRSAGSRPRRLPLAPGGLWAGTHTTTTTRPTESPFLPRGAPGDASGRLRALLPAGPSPPGPLELPAPRSPLKEPEALAQSGPPRGASEGPEATRPSLPTESPAPALPRSHLPDTSAQFPSHLTDGWTGRWPRGPAGGAGGRAAGRGRGRGAEGRPLLRPQLPALWLRLALTLALFPEPRDVTGKQPILVGPRRPPRAGHPTGTRGGHHPGRRGPQLRAPLPGAGRQLSTRALWGHRPRSPVLFSGGRCPPGRLGGGVGCPRCHGDAAPPRGLGRELAAPSGCVPISALTKPPGPVGGLAPRPDLTLYIARLAAGPRRRECLTPTGGYGWLG